jgi:hypothetical protein
VGKGKSSSGGNGFNHINVGTFAVVPKTPKFLAFWISDNASNGRPYLHNSIVYRTASHSKVVCGKTRVVGYSLLCQILALWLGIVRVNALTCTYTHNQVQLSRSSMHQTIPDAGWGISAYIAHR